MCSDINDFSKKQHIITKCEDDAFSIEEIGKLAKLAKIKLSVQEKEEYVHELASVINWVNKLQEIKMDDEFSNTRLGVIDGVTVDQKGDKHDDILHNTHTEHRYFVVPKVIDND